MLKSLMICLLALASLTSGCAHVKNDNELIYSPLTPSAEISEKEDDYLNLPECTVVVVDHFKKFHSETFKIEDQIQHYAFSGGSGGGSIYFLKNSREKFMLLTLMTRESSVIGSDLQYSFSYKRCMDSGKYYEILSN